MSDFQINGDLLSKECDSLAEEIFADVFADNDLARGTEPDDHRDEMTDRVLVGAAMNQLTIHPYKALMVCAHCDTSEGEAFLEDVGWPAEPTLASIASLIVYGEIRARIESRLQELCDEWEAPAGWYGDEDETAGDEVAAERGIDA